MGEVQILIELPEDLHDLIMEDEYPTLLEDVVKRGTVIPKGYGDLIDRQELLKNRVRFEDFDGDSMEIIHEEAVINAKAVIEADKEGE